MNQKVVSLLGLLVFALSGCGTQYNPYWKSYNATQPGQWQVNYSQFVTDSDTELRWTLYVGTRYKKPDYTQWTTDTSWKLVSREQTKSLLGEMWQLVPHGRFYFYVLSIPNTAWYGSGPPATMVGVATSESNNSDNTRLVKDVVYRNVTDAPILLATKPLQLTSVTTNQDEQSITFTWEPLS